jgi:DNA-binding transcriptional LysR family regulator
VPKRFAVRVLYEEDFVVAARAEHPFLKSPGLERFLEARHLLVSETGEAAGIVDAALEKCGLSRRIGVTVPNFAFALVLLAETDLLCALPRRLYQVPLIRTCEPVAQAMDMMVQLVGKPLPGITWLVSLFQASQQ